MTKKKVLVTGSNGLLGQKIIYSLIERKDIDLLASSKGLNRLIIKSGYRYVDLDITKNDEVKEVFENENPDAVINCAAMTNVDYCEENQDSCW